MITHKKTRQASKKNTSTKKYVPRRIRQSLTQKGFDRELIDQVMEEMAESFADEEAAQQLETLICRKYARHLATGDPKDRSKAVDVYKRQAKEALVFYQRDGRFPHGILLEGEEGSGRKTFARLIAAAALCEGENPPCGQ